MMRLNNLQIPRMKGKTMANKGKYYITTAITYTSGKPHIGNSYEIVLADGEDGEIYLEDLFGEELVDGDTWYEDDEGNLYVEDAQGNFYSVDEDGNLSLVEDFDIEDDYSDDEETWYEDEEGNLYVEDAQGNFYAVDASGNYTLMTDDQIAEFVWEDDGEEAWDEADLEDGEYWIEYVENEE